jgi:hypothetical protein
MDRAPTDSRNIQQQHRHHHHVGSPPLLLNHSSETITTSPMRRPYSVYPDQDANVMPGYAAVDGMNGDANGMSLSSMSMTDIKMNHVGRDRGSDGSGTGYRDRRVDFDGGIHDDVTAGYVPPGGPELGNEMRPGMDPSMVGMSSNFGPPQGYSGYLPLSIPPDAGPSSQPHYRSETFPRYAKSYQPPTSAGSLITPSPTSSSEPRRFAQSNNTIPSSLVYG